MAEEPEVVGRFTCKFNTGHGTFTNGVALRVHYDAMHAHEYVVADSDARYKRAVQCDLCPSQVKRSSFTAHARHVHGGTATFSEVVRRGPGRPPSASTVAGATPGFCVTCGATLLRKNIVHHMRSIHGVDAPYGQGVKYWSATQPATELPVLPVFVAPEVPVHEVEDGELPPVDADVDIVLPVIHNLAAPSGVVPVAHMAALFVWRDATVAMLASVQGVK